MHDTLEPLSSLWFTATAACLALIAALVLAGRHADGQWKNRLALLLGLFLLIREIWIHPYLASRGLWTKETSLPLHLCDITSFFSWIALIWRSQLGYECLFYWGIPGAIISLATPEGDFFIGQRPLDAVPSPLAVVVRFKEVATIVDFTPSGGLKSFQLPVEGGWVAIDSSAILRHGGTRIRPGHNIDKFFNDMVWCAGKFGG